jgi:hypothetical protein
VSRPRRRLGESQNTNIRELIISSQSSLSYFGLEGRGSRRFLRPAAPSLSILEKAQT